MTLLPLVPPALRPRVAEITALTDAVCAAHLDDEYALLCRQMAVALAVRLPARLARGEARTWAAGVVHAVGWANFLGDPSQRPHLTTAAVAAACGVGESTLAASSKTVRDALGVRRFDPEWTRPSHLDENPLAWLALVDGIPVDLRSAPLDVQQAAVRAGLIPHVPGVPGAPPDAPQRGGGADLDDARELVQHALDRALADALKSAPRSATSDGPRPAEDGEDADVADALEQLLGGAAADAMARYNGAPQAALGGLSPDAVHALLAADWTSADSAILLDGSSVTLDDLAPARMLHDVRGLLDLLAEREAAGELVKATSKGNLPRALVLAWRDRARGHAAARETWLDVHTIRNEEDHIPLHAARTVAETAGLLKRRSGRFSLTRRGQQLRAEPAAGELLALLVRTLFRRVNLAYLDGAPELPELQQTIGYTVARFAMVGDTWATPAALVPALVLPAVRDLSREEAEARAMAIARARAASEPGFAARWMASGDTDSAASPDLYDPLPHTLELRFLARLEALGLAETREPVYGAGWRPATGAYRKRALFDRVIRVRLPAR